MDSFTILSFNYPAFIQGLAFNQENTVLLLPPGWDAGPSEGYPPAVCRSIHLYTWVERDNVGQSILSKETTMAGTGRRTTDLQIWSPTCQP